MDDITLLKCNHHILIKPKHQTLPQWIKAVYRQTKKTLLWLKYNTLVRISKLL